MSNRPYGDGFYTKVQLLGESTPVMDISDATLDDTNAAYVKQGEIYYSNTGRQMTGTSTFDCDTSTAPSGTIGITADKVIAGYGGYFQAQPVSGSIAIKDNITIDANTQTTTTAIPTGYYPTGTNVVLTNVEANKIVNGEVLFGVEGTGGGGHFQTKTVTGNLGGQTVNPDEGYDAMTQVVIEAVPQTTTPTTHGYCLTIG